MEESVLYNELNTVIEKEISSLPEVRTGFNLSRKENFTFKEIATKLDISIVILNGNSTLTYGDHGPVRDQGKFIWMGRLSSQ